MNSQLILQALRGILMTIGASLATKGVIDQGSITALVDSAMSIVGALMVLVPFAWGLYQRRSQGLIATTAALPQVQGVVVDPKTAADIPAKNVVATPSAVPPATGAL